MERLDRKFTFSAVKRMRPSERVDQNNAMIFLASDNALIPTLRFYQEECRRQGSDERQIKSVGLLIERITKWREENREFCKTPDVYPGQEESIICAPNEGMSHVDHAGEGLEESPGTPSQRIEGDQGEGKGQPEGEEPLHQADNVLCGEESPEGKTQAPDQG